MPSIPQVASCCFCLTTETGTKIIAWICTIIGAIDTVRALILLLAALGKIGQQGAAGNIFDAALLTAISAIFCILGLYLLFGVYKGNQAYVRFWVNAAGIYLIILIIIFILNIILFIFKSGSINIVDSLIFILLIGYFIIVVNSYLREQGNGVETF
uniref:4-hydroxy-2-oxovalerate aldolase 1 n=1 Tax=Lygus hesperus TaxID=30085 RepID=A0A0A9WYA3_LYGHE